MLFRLAIGLSFLAVLHSVKSQVQTIESDGHSIKYYARLNEQLVHSMSVKRMWSSARQEILDSKVKRDKNGRVSAHVDEHDPIEKSNGLFELTSQFTEMVTTEIFQKIFGKFPREDQRWIMDEKNAGTFPDLEPECHIDRERLYGPIKCSLSFRSLQLVYGAYFDLNVTLNTQSLDLTDEEIQERMLPSVKGTSQPIEKSNINMEGLVVAPSKFTQTMKNGYEVTLSERVLKELEVRCNRFLATPLPIVSYKDQGSSEINVMSRDLWKKFVDEFIEYNKANEVDENQEVYDDGFFSEPKTMDEMYASIPKNETTVNKAKEETQCTEDDRSKEETVDMDGLDEYLKTFMEEDINSVQDEL